MRPGPRAAVPIALGILVAIASGCAEESTPSDRPESDARATVRACLAEGGLSARATGTGGLRVGSSAGAPRVLILPSTAAAEARALRGRSEGAEQIGSALLYVGRGSDAVLTRIEACLEEL